MNDKEMLYIDTINDSILESADNMNNETMILFRDMCALAPMTQIKPITWIARYEHVLHDGITHSMNKGECSGVVKDFSLRKLTRWERVNSSDVYDIDIDNDLGEGFAAMVLFPWGEVVHPAYYDNMICLEGWQQIIIDAIIDGAQNGTIDDVYGVIWRWTRA